MSLGKIRAGQAEVELAIRDKIAQGLARAQGRLRAFAVGVRTIGSALFAGLGATSLLGSAKVFADFGSAIHDMSGRTGLAADNLSELKYAAEQTGATLGDVEKAIKFMQKQGIDAKQFDAIAAAVSNIADDTERAQVAMRLFGRNGTAILPMLKDLPELRERARTLGATLTPAQAAKADELGDAFGDLKTALLGVTNQLGAAMAPALIAITQVLIASTVKLGSFVNMLGKATNEQSQKAFAFMERFIGKNAGPHAMAYRELFKWLQGKANIFFEPSKKRPATGMADDLGEMLSQVATGPSSRGTFFGGRAEALSIGSGGGVAQKLDKIADLLRKLNIGVNGTTDAVEDLDLQPQFE